MISEVKAYLATCDTCGRKELFHDVDQRGLPVGWERIEAWREVPAYGNSWERLPYWKHRCHACMKKELACPTGKTASTDQEW